MYDEFISYNADGSPNTEFAPNGRIFNSNYERANTLLTTPDNKIMAMAADTHARIFRFKGAYDALDVNDIQSVAEKIWTSEGKAFVQLPGTGVDISAALLSVDGKLMRRYNATDFMSAGKDIKSVTLPADLPSGTYIFSVKNNLGTRQHKFIY